jgi:flagellar motor switch protein FliG
MFEQILAAMQKPTASAAPLPSGSLDYVQQMMQVTLQLSQAQMEVMNGLSEEVGKEYREVLATADPQAIAQQWPQLMATTVRANAEAGALFMKNAREYQEALLGLARFSDTVAHATPATRTKRAEKAA